jgi:para-aminobenzoate synthetase/4-amino-4-deoxychorismate lyase
MPIKGTAPAGEDVEGEKDAAEHVMIVDLMRNDLGRVCAYGTIEAHPPRIEAHANVFHMVSSVTGTLRDDATDADLLRATFPPGSVTGAPKVQAQKVISELEPTRREAYTGAIGYASPIAGLELSVAIRTFETRGERIWLGAGGGIVAESDPELELAEALDKARGPLAAIGAGLRRNPLPRQPRTLPRALDHGPRPDPDRGLLETILAADGRAPQLETHHERLAASAREVYGLELPDGIVERIEARAAAAAGPSRVRVVATPGAGGLDVAIALTPVGVRPPAHGVTPFLLPGGLGAHKWADRRLVEALAAAAGPGREALIVDVDGAVLEATWANVWIAEAGTRSTPPADGRLLAGVGRARGLAEAGAHEEHIDLARLAAADEVFFTSALRDVTVGPDLLLARS